MQVQDLQAEPESATNLLPFGDVTAWLKDRCRFGKFSSRGHTLYHTYRTWCRSRRECPILQSDWRKVLADRGFSSQRDNSGGMFHGIGLKQIQNATG